jgi:four helix bundle protein
MLKSFRELKVWRKSYDLCLEVFRITKKFPGEERYVLSSQMRKSALSVPSNIADAMVSY